MSSQKQTGTEVFTPGELFQEGNLVEIEARDEDSKTKGIRTFLLEVLCVIGGFPDEDWREAEFTCYRVNGIKMVPEGIYVAATIGPGSDHNLEIGQPYDLEPRGHDGGMFTPLKLGEIVGASIFKTDRLMRPLKPIPRGTP